MAEAARGVDSDLDLSKLAELQELLGSSMAGIVRTLVSELTRAFDTIATALANGDLGAVALGAHAARNSALMIGARPLLAELTELESASRRDDLALARAAHDCLIVSWPRLRRKLEQAGR